MTSREPYFYNFSYSKHVLTRTESNNWHCLEHEGRRRKREKDRNAAGLAMVHKFTFLYIA